jgi:hypothetical protein
VRDPLGDHLDGLVRDLRDQPYSAPANSTVEDWVGALISLVSMEAIANPTTSAMSDLENAVL